MPRIGRVVAVGHPHHITQRGNYRQDVLIDNKDRKTYLTIVQKESEKYGMGILAYCLMTNHVHFIGVPEAEDSMANVFKYVNMKYAQYFNDRRKLGGGHLWQGRYFSSVMGEEYLTACARYIERNPVRVGMVKTAWEWKWSSARVHCGLEREDKLGVLELFEYLEEGSRHGWKDFIDDEDRKSDVEMIKASTMSGRPTGDEGFVGMLEKKLNRSLSVKPRGRPKND